MVDWSRKLNRAGSSFKTTEATEGAEATGAYQQKEGESQQGRSSNEEEQKCPSLIFQMYEMN